MSSLGLLALTLMGMIGSALPDDSRPGVVYEGKSGPGRGRHIVFVTGDEEYRSEESMPQLARILARRHGFRCTVLFSIDPETGEIDPGVVDNIPGLSALEGADLLVIFTRFRDLPDGQMKPIVDYVESGRPIVGLRTATHAFQLRRHPTYAHYDWQSQEGGFGRQVLGETWFRHHGRHGHESTRGIIARGARSHPIVRGLADGDVWDPADVYGVRLPLPRDCETVLFGQVLAGMKPDDDPVGPQTEGEKTLEKNDPPMPIAWVRERTTKKGKTGRVFTTTIGASAAFTREGTRRLLVNACFWALGMEAQIRPDLDVRLVGSYEPSAFGFGGHRKGRRPGDLE